MEIITSEEFLKKSEIEKIKILKEIARGRIRIKDIRQEVVRKAGA